MPECASHQPQRRLGTRVRAQIPVRITSLDPKMTFSENCHTLVVNPKGCGVRCSRPLRAGLEIRIEDLPGRATAHAKVACNRRFDDEGRYWIVGIAFDSPANLWCIAPAPDDWGQYSSPPKFFPASVKCIANDRFSYPLPLEAGGKKV
jgi:hypothetical protein